MKIRAGARTHTISPEPTWAGPVWVRVTSRYDDVVPLQITTDRVRMLFEIHGAEEELLEPL